MTGQIESVLRRLDERLSCQVSRSDDEAYAAATAIWAKPSGPSDPPTVARL
jgi:hypothetical protein